MNELIGFTILGIVIFVLLLYQTYKAKQTKGEQRSKEILSFLQYFFLFLVIVGVIIQKTGIAKQDFMAKQTIFVISMPTLTALYFYMLYEIKKDWPTINNPSEYKNPLYYDMRFIILGMVIILPVILIFALITVAPF